MFKVDDFVKWAYGNLLNNTTRAVVGEYLVHKALDSSTRQRIDWDAYDILYKCFKIEVKSSGYLQTWNKERKYSKITFDIRKKDPWLSKKNEYLGKACRYSDLWIFCVHNEKDIKKQILLMKLNGNSIVPQQNGLINNLVIKKVLD